MNYTLEQIYTPISYEDFNDAIVIIGSSDKGPLMVPVYISDIDSIIKVFGEISELSNACLEAMSVGAKHIIAFRINGKYSTASLYRANVTELAIKLYATNANEEDNLMRASFVSSDSNLVLTIYNADDSIQKQYIVHGDDTIESLVNQINYDASLGFVNVYAETPAGSTACSRISLTNAFGVMFEGGLVEPYVNAADLYNRLEVIYSMLETINFDILVSLPVKYFAYTSVQSEYTNALSYKMFYNQLGDLCSTRKYAGYPITAIIPADDYISEIYGSLHEYVVAMQSRMNQFSDPSQGITIRRSSHIVVVSAQVTGASPYISCGAGAVAGLLNTIRRNISPTNKPLFQTFKLVDEFNTDDARILAELGICTFKNTIRHGVVLVNGVTSRNGADVVSSIRDERLVNHIHVAITAALEQYIGDPIVNQYNNINKSINAVLDAMIRDQAIYDYQYTVSSDQSGNMDITIEVIPYGEIKSVSTSIITKM